MVICVWGFYEEVTLSVIISDDNNVDIIPKGEVSYCVVS